jgi:hypothetical protein
MRSSLNFRLPTAFLVATLAMSGCAASHDSSQASSQDASQASSGALLHACDLLTPPIAKKIIGGSAHRTMKAQPNAHETHCQYQSDTGSIDLMVSDDWEITNEMTDKNSKPVPGLGDEAYIDTMGLRVRKGNRGMEIDATGPSGDYDGAAADAQMALGAKYDIQTAKAIVGRL